jgi:hypothetical protein
MKILVQRTLTHTVPYASPLPLRPISLSPHLQCCSLSLPTLQPIPHSYTRKLARPHSRDRLQIEHLMRKSDLIVIEHKTLLSISIISDD